jgi:hypothetical protein
MGCFVRHTHALYIDQALKPVYPDFRNYSKIKDVEAQSNNQETKKLQQTPITQYIRA